MDLRCAIQLGSRLNRRIYRYRGKYICKRQKRNQRDALDNLFAGQCFF